jgi:hypothetical protein
LNLKKWYCSIIIQYIKDLVMNWEIDIIWVENNIIKEWQSWTEKKFFWTANQPVFIKWLINKLWCILEKKEKNENFYQFTYIEKQSNYNKYQNHHNWVIFFTNEKETSKRCPKCLECWKDNTWFRIKLEKGKNYYKKINQENKNLVDEYMKNNKKIDCVICEKCWFNNNKAYWIQLNDWNEVACFNIAYDIIRKIQS